MGSKAKRRHRTPTVPHADRLSRSGRNVHPAQDQLAARIESLQEGFRQLSRVSSVRDLCVRFSEIVRAGHTSASIDILFLAADSQEWQHIVAGEGTALVSAVTREQLTSLCTVREDDTCICAVQKLVDGALAGIAFTKSDPGGAVDDAVTLRLLAHLFDTAYQDLLSRRNEKELIFSLNHRVLQLNSLIDTGIEVSKLDQDASPQQLALERAAALTNASKGKVKVKRGAASVTEIYFPGGAPFAQPDGEGRGIATEFTFGGESYTFELYDKESRSGIAPFDETDQLLLDALARQVHASLENRYLVRQALEKQRLEQDLNVAAAIQQRILPTALPGIGGYDIAGINVPSRSVGGDYYDCIPLPDGTFALVIADVAGKGMPAALLVSSLHAYLGAYLETGLPLVDLVGRLNRAIYAASTDDKFITALIAILSPETGELESVNAGHNPAYWLRQDGTLVELSAGGVALGMLDMDFPYQSERITVQRGERLLLYTDGIPEATNNERKMYEASVPLQQFFVQHASDSALGFIDDLIQDIRRFTGYAPQSDDITALYLYRCR